MNQEKEHFENFRYLLDTLLNLPSHWSTHHTTYWQHSDHLGSATWITDTNGQGYQYLLYMPWGEPLFDARVANSTYETRYTFSGKERDKETGYSYFGARYYNSDLSLWLSVDPMADKYPNMSPYTYCGNNPVRLVDPDGEEWETPEDQEYANSLIAKAQEKQANYEKGSEGYNKLQEGIDGLTYMGEVKEFKFTFTSENVDHSQYPKVTGNVSIESNKFTINHLSSDNNLDLKDGTAWHEVVHLTRFLKQTPSYTIWSMKNWQPGEVISESPNYGYKKGGLLSIISSQSCPEEIYTYRSQFFFSPNSMVPNAIGNPISIDDIPCYVKSHYKCQDK